MGDPMLPRPGLTTGSARMGRSSAPNAIFTMAPHNSPMDLNSDNPQHGFQFPGEFEITAMGPAGSHLEEQIPALLEAAGLVVLHETVSTRESSGGKFISIKLSFRAESREQYEVAHAVLREHPEVKWTI
jgi:putative lipoic acid-binding regulatory protein